MTATSDCNTIAPYMGAMNGDHAKNGDYQMWKVEVVVDIGGAWCGNDLRFATKEEAETYARDLVSRWPAVLDWRAVQEEETQ